MSKEFDPPYLRATFSLFLAQSHVMHVQGLSCFACGKRYAFGTLLNLCECGKPLRVDIDLASIAIRPSDLKGRRKDLWRYREVLPLPANHEPMSLGEGGTPLLETNRLAASLGLTNGSLFVKDEAVNPTGSFKARGMAMAVPMAKLFGATKLAVPSAGNAGGAMAAYAARYGLEAHVFMPKDVPAANRLECEMAGAHITLVDGLINDCAKIIADRKDAEGWFELSTLKEPYRIEGKKTMGYEIAEQFDWNLPDVILYPTGGGTGLIGMWKAFDEMEQVGWIGSKRPRMVSVQAEGCNLIPKAIQAGKRDAGMVENASTVASGLRVPKAIGDFIMFDLIQLSHGTALAISDKELMQGAYELSELTGISAAPEGGACLAALKELQRDRWIQATDKIVIFNTGTGLKYAEAFKSYPRN